MAQVGLEDTPLNRDAATEEIFRARADTLLASAADPRKPKLTGDKPQEQERIEVGMATTPPLEPALHWSADGPPATPSVEAAVVETTSPIIEPAAETAPAKRAKPAPKELPLSRFDEQLEELIANHRDDWEEDTASDVRVLVGIFRGILEEHDVTHSGEITQEHVAALRQHFNHIIPTTVGARGCRHFRRASCVKKAASGPRKPRRTRIRSGWD